MAVKSIEMQRPRTFTVQRVAAASDGAPRGPQHLDKLAAVGASGSVLP
jgi:hypothetical protein